VRKSCEFARKWRNQRLAHTDLINRRKGHALTLPPVTGNDIESALKSIGDLLTLVEDHYGLPHSVLGPDPWGQNRRFIIWRKPIRQLRRNTNNGVSWRQRPRARSYLDIS